MSQTQYRTDTTAEANSVQLDCWKKMTPQERVKKAFSLSTQLRNMAFNAIRRRNPDWNEDQVQLNFIELTYGAELANDVAKWKSEHSVE